MPYLTLTLSGQPVDLPADAAVALSYRANDLRNLESREAAFSETFTLPLTAQNVAVLGAPHALDSLTTTPYRLLPAVLTSPGGAVLLEGFGILELAHEGYDITLTDAVGGLFALVGERTLQDLDLSAYDHLLTFAAVQDGDARTWQQGYAYALADTGALTQRLPADGIMFYEVPLAVYYHTILAAIVTQALRGLDGLPLAAPLALRLSGSLLAETTYQQAVMPRATAAPQVRAKVLARNQVSAAILVPTPYPGFIPDGTPFFDNGTHPFTNLAFTGNAIDPGANFFAGTYFRTPAYRADVTVKIKLLAQLAPTAGYPSGGPCGAVLDLRDEGLAGRFAHPATAPGVYDRRALYIGLTGGIPRLPVMLEYTVPLTFLAPPAAGGSAYITLCLQAAGVDVTLLPGCTISYEVGARAYPGGPVHVEAALPELKQADFLKLVCNQFNALIQLDPRTRAVRFDLFNDLERNRAAAVDWSDKIDFTRRPRLAFRLGEYAQRNLLHYDAPPPAYAAIGAVAPVPLGTGSLYAVNATLVQQTEAYAAPVLLPQAHLALSGAGPLLWLPLLAEPALTAIGYARPWTPAGVYSTTTPPAIYGGLRWLPDLPLTANDATAGRFIEANNPPSFAPVQVRTTAGDTVPRAAWKLAPYDVPVQALPAVAQLVRPGIAAPALVRDEGSPATYAPTAQLSRAGFDFAALVAAYYPGLTNALARVQVLTVDVRLNAMDIARLDYVVPKRLTLPAVAGFGALDCLGYVNLIDQYAPGIPGSVAVTLLVLGAPVVGLAPKVPMPPLARPRRALAAETAALLLLETGQYILPEA